MVDRFRTYEAAHVFTVMAYRWIVLHEFLPDIVGQDAIDAVPADRRRRVLPARERGDADDPGRVLGGRLPVRAQPGPPRVPAERDEQLPEPAGVQPRQPHRFADGWAAAAGGTADQLGPVRRRPPPTGRMRRPRWDQPQHQPQDRRAHLIQPVPAAHPRRRSGRQQRARVPEHGPGPLLRPPLRSGRRPRHGSHPHRRGGPAPRGDPHRGNGSVPAERQAALRAAFAADTPLWFYLLAESGRATDGATLGPVGGRIVAEVFVDVLRRQQIVPPPGFGRSFGLADLLVTAGVASR